MEREHSRTVCKDWMIQSRLGAEIGVSRDIASFLGSCFPEEPRLPDMLTAVTEACLNAFEHGNRFDPSAVVKVRVEVDPWGYHFYVADQGAGMSALPEDVPVEEKWKADKPRGWGLYLIRSLCDRVETGRGEDGFHRIKMTFDRELQEGGNG